DKLSNALEGLGSLMKSMPESPKLFESSKQAILSRLSTERLEKTGLLFDFETMTRLGIDHDIRKDIYQETGNFTLRDIEDFHRKHFMNRRHVMLVLGKKSSLDLQVLRKYGTLKELGLRDIFGY
ncbi:MAG: insulinase family protein, partial [Chlorobiaceae bacterium]|nr:insulinase family protein [Chlorobiaceae bacterium]